MSDDIVTMFAQAYSKKKPTLLAQQGSNVKIVDLPYTDKKFYFNSCIFKDYDGKILLIARESTLIG